jgi:urease
VGQVAPGTLADLVLWKPENFGSKPEMVIKSGVIAWSQVRLLPTLVCSRALIYYLSIQMGDANASIPSVQPFFGKPMWGAKPGSAALNSLAFVSQISIASGKVHSYGLSKRFEAVRNCRSVSKKDMKWNDATPKMQVDPESYEVYVFRFLENNVRLLIKV